MAYTIDNKDDFTRVVTIDVRDDELTTHTDAALDALAKDLTVKGFRPGNVPRDVAQKHLDPIVVRQHAVQAAVNSALSQAEQDKQFKVLETRNMNVTKNDPEHVQCEVTFTVIPDIEIGPYKDQTITKEEKKVSDQDIQRVINDIAGSRAKETRVERKAQKGDKVTIDVVVHDDTQQTPQENKGHDVILGQTKLLAGLQESLTGMETGQSKKVTLEDAKHDVTVTIQAIYDRELPTIDDAFAKDVAKLADLAALKQHIQTSLQQEHDMQEARRLRIALLDMIRDAKPFSVPEYLVERRVDVLMHDFEQQLQQQQLTLAQYAQQLKKTVDDLKKEWKPQAEKQVAMDLLIQMIAAKENLHPSLQEIQKTVEQTLEGYAKQYDTKAVANIDRTMLQNQIGFSMLKDRVFAFLEKHNTFTTEAGK